MTSTRRTFLTVLAGVAALPVVGLCTRWADDDTAYLQWLIDTGRPIPPREYVLRRQLVIRRDTTIQNCTLRMRGEGRKIAVLLDGRLSCIDVHFSLA